MTKKSLVVAHRGATVGPSGETIRENTLAAFLASIEMGADGIELDVRRAADDVLVIHHDATLEDGRMIRECLAEDLPEWLPTLAEAMDALPEVFLNIEIKNHPSDPDYDAEQGVSVAVAGLVAAFDAHHRVLVSSFEVETLERIRQTDPTIQLGWLVWGQADPAMLMERTASHSFAAIHPHDLLVDQAFVNRANAAGVDVHVWTVDDPDRITELAALGVTSIITNTTAIARAALD